MLTCYEEEDKLSKCFRNFENTKAALSIIEKLEIENKGISDLNEKNNEINRFFETLLAKTLQ